VLVRFPLDAPVDLRAHVDSRIRAASPSTRHSALCVDLVFFMVSP